MVSNSNSRRTQRVEDESNDPWCLELWTSLLRADLWRRNYRTGCQSDEPSIIIISAGLVQHDEQDDYFMLFIRRMSFVTTLDETNDIAHRNYSTAAGGKTPSYPRYRQAKPNKNANNFYLGPRGNFYVFHKLKKSSRLINFIKIKMNMQRRVRKCNLSPLIIFLKSKFTTTPTPPLIIYQGRENFLLKTNLTTLPLYQMQYSMPMIG